MIVAIIRNQKDEELNRIFSKRRPTRKNFDMLYKSVFEELTAVEKIDYVPKMCGTPLDREFYNIGRYKLEIFSV